MPTIPCAAPSQAFSANVSETRGNSFGQRDLIGHMETELGKLEF